MEQRVSQDLSKIQADQVMTTKEGSEKPAWHRRMGGRQQLLPGHALHRDLSMLPTLVLRTALPALTPSSAGSHGKEHTKAQTLTEVEAELIVNR